VTQFSVIIDHLHNTYELCCARNVCCRIDPLQFTLSYFHLGIIGLMVYGLAIFLHRKELCKMYLSKYTQKMVTFLLFFFWFIEELCNMFITLDFYL
jgi:hypothetical protein